MLESAHERHSRAAEATVHGIAYVGRRIMRAAHALDAGRA